MCHCIIILIESMFGFSCLVLGAVEPSKSGLSPWKIKPLNHSAPEQKRRNEKVAWVAPTVRATAEDRFESAQGLISAVRDLLQSGIKCVQLSSDKVIFPSRFCAAAPSPWVAHKHTRMWTWRHEPWISRLKINILEISWWHQRGQLWGSFCH